MNMMPWKKAGIAAGALAVAAGPLLASMAVAQSYPPPSNYPGQNYPGQNYPSQNYPSQTYPNQQGYPTQPGYPDQQGYPNQQGYPSQDYNGQGYDQASPSADLPPPPGYDGRDLPPPPPGYQVQGDPGAYREADERYAQDAQRWARQYCVKSQGNVGAGAVIGGIFGAIIGSGLSGRHDRGAGTFAGAAIGAVGGAAIASGTGGNDTSPGCPPGYVTRGGASYSYSVSGYNYAAPGWYRPWVYVGSAWTYRPYPYHDWYYRTYRGHGYGGGYRGGYGGYRGDHGGNRGHERSDHRRGY
ncbi:hypothetical protein [Novosphingobium sp.]|uniref:hypothetical protein n=1 Tax=Novosphingobium sp. TaxID=1874826 RepID=UPI0025D52CEA|nr:hypothetical protein [Novosphingobium sp.]